MKRVEFGRDGYTGSLGFRVGRLIVSWSGWRPADIWLTRMLSCWWLKLGPLELVWVRRW